MTRYSHLRSIVGLLSFLLGLCGAAQAQVTVLTERTSTGRIDYVVAGPPARLVIATPAGRRTSGELLLEMANRIAPEAILSGGYLESLVPARALGLVKTRGLNINSSHNSWLTTGMVCTSGASARVLPYDDSTASRFDDCIQAGPMIVQNGRDRYKSGVSLASGEASLARSVSSYGFACEHRSGRTIVMGFVTQTRLTDVSAFLAGAVGCRNAVRLTGAETGGFWTRRTGLVGQSSTALPNALAIVAR